MRNRNWNTVIGLLLISLLGTIFFGCRKEEGVTTEKGNEGGDPPYDALMPEEAMPAGWALSGAVKTYAGKKLYDSIDGAADSFFQYAFREQYVATYTSKNPERAIEVDVYDMGTPEDAFGIFSSHDNIMSQHTNIGLAAILSDASLDFCQGNYFARLFARDFNQGEAEKPLQAFAKALAGNIKPPADFPDLVRRLPKGYVEGTVLFFHTLMTLNQRRYIAEENVLHLNRKTNGVLAAYTSEEKEAEGETFKLEKDVLFLVEYPDKEKANAARTSYISFLDKLVKDSMAEGQPESEALQLIGIPQEPIQMFQLYKGEEGHKHLAMNMRVFRNYIFGVWDITDADKAKTLVKSVVDNLRR